MFDYDEDTIRCKFQSQVATSWPTSLGLTVTVPCKENYKQALFAPHNEVLSRFRTMYNSTNVHMFSGDRFGTAPVTRLSGHFPWAELPLPACEMHLEGPVVDAVKIIGNITVQAACKSNQYLRYGALKLSLCDEPSSATTFNSSLPKIIVPSLPPRHNGWPRPISSK